MSIAKKDFQAPEEIQTRLEYKQQQEFFTTIYEYFRDYQEAFSNFYTDDKAGLQAFKAIIKLISSSKAQLAKVLNLKTLDAKKEQIKKLIYSKEWKKARENLDELSTLVFAGFEKLGISPTIHMQEDKLSAFWREEENAGIKEMKKAFYDSFMLPEE